MVVQQDLEIWRRNSGQASRVAQRRTDGAMIQMWNAKHVASNVRLVSDIDTRKQIRQHGRIVVQEFLATKPTFSATEWHIQQGDLARTIMQ